MYKKIKRNNINYTLSPQFSNPTTEFLMKFEEMY